MTESLYFSLLDFPYDMQSWFFSFCHPDLFILAPLGVIITAFIKKKPFAKGIERED